MRLFKKKKETEQDILIERIKTEQINIKELFSNINYRREVETLYKELCKLSHPDRYEKDSVKKELAKEIFTKIQNSKNNYSQLMELKNIIEIKLK